MRLLLIFQKSIFDESCRTLICRPLGMQTEGVCSVSNIILGEFSGRRSWASTRGDGGEQMFLPAALGDTEKAVTLEPRGRGKPREGGCTDSARGQGEAPWSVHTQARPCRFRASALRPGAHPFTPPLPGLQFPPLQSETSRARLQGCCED